LYLRLSLCLYLVYVFQIAEIAKDYSFIHSIRKNRRIEN